jgi:probable F420-dependent oxidoreductase
MPGGDLTDIPDPLIWLSFLAGQTTTLKLATGILILPQRNPVVLAKECATLDKLSGGRLVLGIGVGWLEEEFDALGVPFAERGRRTDEYVHVMRALWSEEKASYHGDFVNFDRAISQPKPVDGAVPIVIGGHTAIAARRAGRLGDGFFPGKGSNDELRALLAVMRESAEKAGRDPDAIEVTTGGAAAFAPDPVEALGELAEMGISRVVIPPLSFNPTKIGDKLADFGENVIAKVNA